MKIAYRFLAWTFLITWISWISLIIMVSSGLMAFGDISFMIPYALGGFGPSLAAFIAVRKDKEARRALTNTLFRFRIPIGWYAGILLLPLVISAVAWAINWLITGPAGPFLTKPLYMALALLPVMIIGGGLEEIGWRGILLPRLLHRTSAFKATGIVSLIWGIWHLPLWFIPGVAQHGSNYVYFILNIISISILMTVLYRGSGSLFACLIFHAIGNSYASIGMNAWAVIPVSRMVSAAVSLLIPLLLAIGPRHLVRPSSQDGPPRL